MFSVITYTALYVLWSLAMLILILITWGHFFSLLKFYSQLYMHSKHMIKLDHKDAANMKLMNKETVREICRRMFYDHIRLYAMLARATCKQTV